MQARLGVLAAELPLPRRLDGEEALTLPCGDLNVIEGAPPAGGGGRGDGDVTALGGVEDGADPASRGLDLRDFHGLHAGEQLCAVVAAE